MDTLSHASSGALTGAAVAECLMPASGTSFMVIGLIAGLIPDIDFLAEIRGKLAAWTMHRIIAHNIPVALLLTTLFSIGVSWLASLPWTLVFVCCVAATGIHLLLDVLTSFGTCLFYPFSNARFTTRSHFIFDPFVIVLSVFGLLGNNASFWLVILLCYLLFGVLVRHAWQLHWGKQFSELGNCEGIQLEPQFLAPFRWMIIVRHKNGYRYAYQTLFWRGRWFEQQHYVSNSRDEIPLRKLCSACKSNELLNAVLATFDMPLYTVVQKQSVRYVIVEDLKWRLEAHLRPLAFTAKLERDQSGGIYLTDVRQGGFFQPDQKGLFKSVGVGYS